jgi:DNA repair photolyase
LPFVARGIPAEFKQRLIFGVSTGTANDRIAGAFEAGAPLVSKRIESIHQLQDEGYRTFGMICPSLPQADGVYDEFSKDMIERLRIDRMEDVWAEPINVRGSSMTKTRDALSEAGFPREAALVESVSGDAAAWEHYARMTFLAHARNIPSKKLKFLQYVTPHTLDWWTPQIKNGAVLLGKAAVHA